MRNIEGSKPLTRRSNSRPFSSERSHKDHQKHSPHHPAVDPRLRQRSPPQC
jgi:hypothetical protein